MTPRLWIVLLTWLAPMSSGWATPICDSVRGDINLDGSANLLDIQCHALYTATSIAESAEDTPSCFHPQESEVDHNCDGESNIIDVLMTVQAALHIPWGKHVDGDWDGCADTCESILFQCEEGWFNPDCDTGIGHCPETGGCALGETCVDIDGGHMCVL